jgi:hypothetical protein
LLLTEIKRHNLKRAVRVTVSISFQQSQVLKSQTNEAVFRQSHNTKNLLNPKARTGLLRQSSPPTPSLPMSRVATKGTTRRHQILAGTTNLHHSRQGSD